MERVRRGGKAALVGDIRAAFSTGFSPDLVIRVSAKLNLSCSSLNMQRAWTQKFSPIWMPLISTVMIL